MTSQPMASESQRPWTPIVAPTLSSSEIRALLLDEVPFVRVPKFLSPAWCAEVSERFLTQMASLPENRLPVGPAQLSALVKPLDLFMHSYSERTMAEYFDDVQTNGIRMREVFRGGEDPVAKLRSMWESAGWKCVIANEDGRPYHTDIIWSIFDGGAQAPHVDTYQSDRQTNLSRFARRISWNIFLRAPDSGGGFVAYRRRKQAVDVVGPDGVSFRAEGPSEREDFKWVADFDKVSDLVSGFPHGSYQPECGDMIIFDACNYHEVKANSGHRIVSHANLAVDPRTREFAFYV